MITPFLMDPRKNNGSRLLNVDILLIRNMKMKIIRFVTVFAYFFGVYYFFSTDRDIRYLIFISTMMAVLDAFTYKYVKRFITYTVKKL